MGEEGSRDLDVIFWAVLAGLGFVGEPLSVSFFLLFFSLGSVVALALAFAGLGHVAQAIGSIAATVLGMVVLRPALLNRLALKGGEGYAGRYWRERIEAADGMRDKIPCGNGPRDVGVSDSGLDRFSECEVRRPW